MTQQLQKQLHRQLMNKLLFSPPSFTLRSDMAFIKHKVQHGSNVIKQRPGQYSSTPTEWKVCAARGPEQHQARMQFRPLTLHVAEISFSFCSSMA
mmetsp:Transcript_139001/g.277152  ORF Transcript_139001/g.277152 Transcript_139001/m.277152 type:complete len:95 (+) Transcript_139001:128-412(+)